MQIIRRKQSLFEQTFSQRATTTAESKRTQNLPKHAIDFKNKFETYLKGQTSSIDVIKYGNTLPTKKYQNNLFSRKKTINIGSNLHQQEQLIDYNNIKEFISDHDQAYTEMNKSLKTQPSLQERKSTKSGQRTQIKSDYQENKRLNHFNLIAESYREQIRCKNLVSSPEKCIFMRYMSIQEQNKSKNQINCFDQVSFVVQTRPQLDTARIQSRIKMLKQENCCKSSIANVFSKLFRATSDHYIDTLQMNCNIQTSELHKFGDLDFYELDDKRTVQTERLLKSKSSSRQMRHLLKRNEHCPNNQDDDCLVDESVISETEAKLNIFYGQSKDFQKKIMNKNENPNKIINLINKVDQIRENIYRVNTNKLYGVQ